ncbi:protein of unknown function [Burkholderia multivorans]
MGGCVEEPGWSGFGCADINETNFERADGVRRRCPHGSGARCGPDMNAAWPCRVIRRAPAAKRGILPESSDDKAQRAADAATQRFAGHALTGHGRFVQQNAFSRGTDLHQRLLRERRQSCVIGSDAYPARYPRRCGW